jgi:hypothetical protein
VVRVSRRPKDIGTDAERAVVRYLNIAGFPHAERRALRGGSDAGDITGTVGVVWEVKGGKAAKTASDAQIARWLEETETEKLNGRATVGVLVVQRPAIGPARAGHWWAIMTGWQYEALCSNREGHGWLFGDQGPIRMHLYQCCALLTFAGYGGPATGLMDNFDRVQVLMPEAGRG